MPSFFIGCGSSRMCDKHLCHSHVPMEVSDGECIIFVGQLEREFVVLL